MIQLAMTVIGILVSVGIIHTAFAKILKDEQAPEIKDMVITVVTAHAIAFVCAFVVGFISSGLAGLIATIASTAWFGHVFLNEWRLEMKNVVILLCLLLVVGYLINSTLHSYMMRLYIGVRF
jgi:hypothetical protein